MRQLFTLAIIIIPSICLFGQTNPEDIIILYNDDGTKKVIYKKDLASDPDSVNSMLLPEVEALYILKIDSSDFLNRLIGNWTFISAKRTNGKDANFSKPESYEFKRDGTFISFDGGEKYNGKWVVREDGTADINLTYDNPKVMIKDKNILKYLDKEALKSITFSSETISFSRIDSTSMTIRASTILSDQNKTDGTFFRIILFNYDRNSN